MFACSAGGPGFDSRLRRLVASVLPMLYAEDVGGPGQAPTVPSIFEIMLIWIRILMKYGIFSIVLGFS